MEVMWQVVYFQLRAFHESSLGTLCSVNESFHVFVHKLIHESFQVQFTLSS